MKKIFTLSIAVALFGVASADTVQVLSCAGGIPGMSAEEPQLLGLSISPNGKYICGSIEKGIGVFAANRLTGEVKWQVTLDGDRDGDQLKAIDNEGVAIGFLEDAVLYSFDTDTFTALKAPAGFKYCIGEDITPDGNMKVGSLVGTGFLTDAAFTIDNVNWTLLPMPTEEEFGGLIDGSKGSSAKMVSVDGKVILGHVGSFGAPIVWVKNDTGVYEPDFFMARYVKATSDDINDTSKPLVSLSGMYKYMSGNGKYVVMMGLIPAEIPGETRSVPVVYDTEKKDIKIYDEIQEIDELELTLYPLGISDDGTFIGTVGQPLMGSMGAFIMLEGKTQAEWFNDVFPQFSELLGEADAIGFNNPTDITPDGRFILGHLYYCEDYMDPVAPAYFETYIIDRGENTGVNEVSSNIGMEYIYSVDGRALREMTKGINIVRKADGSVLKIMNK